MDTHAQLTRLFTEHWSGEPLSAEALEEIGQGLAEAVARGRAAWPDVVLTEARFVASVARHAARGDDPVAAVASLRADDLWLACACQHQDPNALTAFETEFMPRVALEVRSMRADAATADDIAQQLREKLLVGDPGRGPRIGDYGGRGALARWLKASAVRAYLNSRRGIKEVPVSDEPVLDALSEPTDPEVAVLKDKYRREFADAFAEAMASLSDRDKALLRYAHVDGLNLDALGRAFQVSRATAHRWLTRARETLAAQTEARLSARLQLRHSEFHSIRRLVQSQVNISVRRLLQ